MKKHFLALGLSCMVFLPIYSYAEETPSTLTSSTSVSNVGSSTNYLITNGITTPKTFTICSQEAIEVRDTSIASSRVTYNTAMANALTERKNSEKTAVAIKNEDAKKYALKLSVETYKREAKAAQTALIQARKITWQTFDNDIKKCRSLEDIEVSSKSSDEQLVAGNEPTPILRKMEKAAEKVEEKETKTIKETIKAQFESFKSLFN